MVIPNSRVAERPYSVKSVLVSTTGGNCTRGVVGRGAVVKRDCEFGL